jgi:hypothetical protein
LYKNINHDNNINVCSPKPHSGRGCDNDTCLFGPIYGFIQNIIFCMKIIRRIDIKFKRTKSFYCISTIQEENYFSVEKIGPIYCLFSQTPIPEGGGKNRHYSFIQKKYYICEYNYIRYFYFIIFIYTIVHYEF